MTARRTRTRGEAIRRRALRASAGIALAAMAGVAATGASRAPGPPPGRLIDVGGFTLHIHCVGEGSPTVVLDAGAGAWSLHFAHVQRALSGTTVCTYDRAGLGWSQPGPMPRTSGRMAGELHRLLHTAGLAPPFVLVGHSLGGYNVRIYQARYPGDVAAVVLLDAAHERQWDALPPEARHLAQASVAVLRGRAEQARKGALRPADIEPPGVFVAHSPSLRDAYTAAMLTPAPYETLAAETEAAFESARQVPAGHRLGDTPLVVLTARRSFDAFSGSGIPIDPANAIWLDLQRELAALSRNTRHLFSDGNHRLHETDPEAVVSAIRIALAAARSATGLPRASISGTGPEPASPGAPRRDRRDAP